MIFWLVQYGISSKGSSYSSHITCLSGGVTFLSKQSSIILLSSSEIFPSNEILCKLIENENVCDIDTDYLNGPVSKTIGEGKLKGTLIMDTHGGRPRKIEAGELKIDVAFIACPSVDKLGNGYGGKGKAACGSLGYAIADLKYAKKVVLVTDNIVDKLDKIEVTALPSKLSYFINDQLNTDGMVVTSFEGKGAADEH